MQADGLNSQQATALRHHNGLRVLECCGTQHCDWLLYAPREAQNPDLHHNSGCYVASSMRPTDRNDRLEVCQRRSCKTLDRNQSASVAHVGLETPCQKVEPTPSLLSMRSLLRRGAALRV